MRDQDLTTILFGSERLLHRLLRRLGARLSVSLTIIGVDRYPSDGEVDHAVVAMGPSAWRPNDAGALVAAVRRKAATSRPDKSLARLLSGQSDLGDTLRYETSSAFEGQGTVRRIVGPSIEASHLVAVVVVEGGRDEMDAYPAIDASVAHPQHETDDSVRISLVDSAISVCLATISTELRGRAGFDLRPHANVDDLMRRAGASLLRDVDRAILRTPAILGEVTYARLEAISATSYEKRAAKGAIVLGSQADGPPLGIRFLRPVSLSETRRVRKLLEMAQDEYVLLSVENEVVGLARSSELRFAPFQPFEVTFHGRHEWSIAQGETRLATFRDGLPALPKMMEKTDFLSTYHRVFPEHDEGAALRAYAAIRRVVDHRVPTVVVVAADAAAESNRLEMQGTPIHPTQLEDDAIARAASIDGAILLDANSSCHAIGVILDGQATSRGKPARGARFNSALCYVTRDTVTPGHAYPRRMAVVISEDGSVDLLPRLRAQAAAQKLAEVRDQMRSRKGALAAGERADAVMLLQYRDEVGLDDAERHQLVRLLFPGFERDDDDIWKDILEFDPHPSDSEGPRTSANSNVPQPPTEVA